MSRDNGGDGGCCCCCAGLAIGYLIWGGDNVDAMTISHKAESAIEQTIEEDRGMLLNMIDNYQQNISPQIKADLGIEKICKFTPSCSEYAKQAIEEYGPVKGTVKATKRLLKCNPLTKGGYDPLV